MSENKGGVKHDAGKNRWDLLPYDAVNEIVKVFSFGSKKYSDRNWEAGFDWGRVYAALQRHLALWFQGQDNDPETGLSHLAHAGCCLLFLLTFVLRGAGRDNRPKLSNEQLEHMTDMHFGEPDLLRGAPVNPLAGQIMYFDHAGNRVFPHADVVVDPEGKLLETADVPVSLKNTGP